jgi:hypothetical protein
MKKKISAGPMKKKKITISMRENSATLVLFLNVEEFNLRLELFEARIIIAASRQCLPKCQVRKEGTERRIRNALSEESMQPMLRGQATGPTELNVTHTGLSTAMGASTIPISASAALDMVVVFVFPNWRVGAP